MGIQFSLSSRSKSAFSGPDIWLLYTTYKNQIPFINNYGLPEVPRGPVGRLRTKQSGILVCQVGSPR